MDRCGAVRARARLRTDAQRQHRAFQAGTAARRSAMQRTDAPTQALFVCLLRRWWCMLPDTLLVCRVVACSRQPAAYGARCREGALAASLPHSELLQTLHGNNSHRWYDKLQFNVDASACRPIYSSAKGCEATYSVAHPAASNAIAAVAQRTPTPLCGTGPHAGVRQRTTGREYPPQYTRQVGARGCSSSMRRWTGTRSYAS